MNKAQAHRGVLILFIFLLTLSLTFQPQVSAQLPKLQFQHVTVEQGLSHPAVFEICEDSSGFMWFGSFSGLNRYDGNEIKSVKSPSIHALCTGTNGDVWIGSAAGAQWLSCLSAARDTMIDYQLPAFGAGVRALVNDSDGSLWVGTDAGLFHKDVRSEKFILMGTQALADSGVNSMADDKHGNLWLVTRGKIVRFDKVTGRGYAVCQRQYGGHSATSVGPDGSLWVAGGINGLLCRIDPKSMRVDSIFEKGPRVPTSSVAVDGSGIVYIGTSGMGLKIYDPAARSWVTYRHRARDPCSICDDDINTVVLDRTGNIWIGTSSGVSWAPRWGRRFSFVSIDTDDKDLLRPQEVRDIVEDSDGNLWLATARGSLRKLDRRHNTVTVLRINSRDIYSLGLAYHTRLWIGMREGLGLRQLDIADTTSTKTEPVPHLTEIDGVVTAMLKEGERTMWLGCTSSRVYRYNLRTGETVLYRYETPEELFPGRVAFFGEDCPRMIYRDRKGTLWIATAYGILNLDERSGSFRRHLHTATEEMNFQQITWFQENTWCVYEDTRGNFWVGTDVGFDLFDREQQSFHPVIHTSRRFQGRTVLGILEDKAGMLWLQTDGELLRYNHTTGETKHFGAKDGYPVTMLNSFFTLGNRARCITHAGELVFGVRDGIVIFRPEEIVDNPNKPPVVITEAKILGQVLARNRSRMSDFFLPHQPLRLSADENSLEFKFAAFDYTMPSQNKYAMRLEPSDKDWISLGTENSTRFVNLPSGSYLLRVKAANNDSVWSATEATFDFRIYPPWYKTLWAYIGYVFAIGLAIYLIFRARIARLKALERLRMNIAGDLHDELGTGLSSIALQTELFSRTERSATEQKDALAEIVKTARTLADSTRDVVWVLAPQHERLSDLVLKMRTEAPRILAVEDPAFAEHLEHPEVTLSTQARKHVLLMCKEILHNVQRHAHAERVSIEINEMQGVFQLSVRDSGIGFVPDNANCVYGLRNLHFRAKELGGTLTITSVPGKGTTVQFSVELTRLRD